MAEAVLITGGNIGDVQTTLNRCNRLINKHIGELIRTSTVIESDPWGFVAEQAFLNQVLIVNTKLSPVELLKTTQMIERELGRESKSKTENGKAIYASRNIDIDILFYDELIIETPTLTIPHPHLHERDFVLTPLCEVDGKRRHPVLGKSMEELKNRLKTD